MMIDSNLVFDPDNTALTVSRVSTNILDLAAQRDIGVGAKLRAFLVIQQTLLAAGAATLQIGLQGAPDNGAGAPGAFGDMILSPVLGKAVLTLGQTIDLPIPQLPPSFGDKNAMRFLQLNYIVATGPFTAGQITAFVGDSSEVDENNSYPSGFTVAA